MTSGETIQSLRIPERQADSFSDDFSFYRARIYKRCGPGDDRLQVRIMPHLAAVPADEVENLPCFPFYFNNTVEQGLAETDDGVGAEKAEYVGVIATPDFQFGYILGLLNDNRGSSKSKKHMSNYSFGSIAGFLSARGAKPKDFAYKDIVVTRRFSSKDPNTDEAQGGQVELYNRKTGDYVLMLTSGTIITAQNQCIYLRCGSPGKDGAAVGFSSIKMTPSSIEFQAPKIDFVKYNSLILGRHGSVPVGTLGPYNAVACEGMDLRGTNNIFL